MPRCEKRSPALLILLSVVFVVLLFSPLTLPPNSLSRLGADGPLAVSSPPLTVTATATPTAGKVPLNVSFTGSVSGGTGCYALFWDFGDTTSSTGSANVSHLYTVPGSFTAQFWAQDCATSAKTFAPLTITVFATGRLTVKVLDPSVRPIASAMVRSLSQPQGQNPLTGNTVVNGSLNFGTVAAGTYSLEAAASGFENSTVTVTVPAGGSSLATITLTPKPNKGLDPTALIAYTALGISASVLLLLLFYRRRRRLHSSPGPPRRASLPAQRRRSTLSGTR